MTDNPSIVAMFENIDVYGRNPPSDQIPDSADFRKIGGHLENKEAIFL